MRTESDKQRIQIAQYGTIQVQHNVSDSVDQLQHDTDSNSLSERTIAFLALLAVQLGFGCYGVMLKPWGDTLDPLLFNLLRDCGTCMLLLYAASLHEPGGILIPPPEDHLLFAAMGVLGMFGAQVSYVVAVSLSGPAVCALYTPLVPVVTTMLAVCTGMESLIPCTMPNAFKSGGIIISAAGALVMVAAADSGQQAAVESQSAANTFWGNVLMLFQVFCTSSFHLMQQRFIYQVHKDDARGARWSQRPICLTAWAYGSGSVVMAVVALPYSYIRPEFVDFDASGLIPLTYSILVASCMCYTLMTYANRVLSATIATAFWPLQVLVATTMARTCYGEALTQVEIMAGCLIVVGMFCIVWSSSMPTIETVHSET